MKINKDYLDSKHALKQYVNIVRKDNFNTDDIKKDWKKFLVDKKIVQDVSADDDAELYPSKLVTNVYSAIEDNEVLNSFNIIFNSDAGLLNIQPKNDGAYTHYKNGKNSEDTFTFNLRKLIPETIYTLIKVDEQTYKNSDAIVQMILNDAPRRLSRQIATAILVGGVINDNGQPFNAIMPIASDELTNNTFVEDNLTLDILMGAINSVSGDFYEKVVFVNGSVLSNLLLVNPDTAIILNSPSLLGATIVTTDIISGNSQYNAIIVNTNKYFLGLSDQGLTSLDDFDIKSNSHYIESFVNAEGSLTESGASAVIIKQTQPSQPSTPPSSSSEVTLNNVVVTVTKDGAPYNLNIGTVTAVPGGRSVLLPAPKIDGYTVSGTNINGEFEVAIRPDGSHVDMLTDLTYTKNNGGASSSSSTTPSSSSSTSTPSSSTSSTSSSKESTPSSSTPSKESSSSKADTTSSTPSESLTTSAETSSKAAVPAATTNAAKKSIDSMDGLTDGQKAAATSAVDSATTPAGVQATVDAAKNGGNTASTSTSGDVQTGVNSGVFAAIAGGFTALMSGVGLAFRKLH